MQALSWLEMHYWNFQEQKLLEAQTLLRLTVLEYFTLLDRIFSERRFHDPSTDGVEVSVARKQTKRARKGGPRQIANTLKSGFACSTRMARDGLAGP